MLDLENVIITPHVAFISEESILELQVTAATYVAEVLSGKRPDTVVNPSVLNQSNLRSELLRQQRRSDGTQEGVFGAFL